MQWSEFVEGCEEWSDEKILKNIGRIESFGQAEEVKGILDYIPNGYRDFFVQKALDAGVKLSIYDIADLEEYISRDMMRGLLDPIIEKKRVFSEKEIFARLNSVFKVRFLELLLQKMTHKKLLLQTGGKNSYLPNYSLICIIRSKNAAKTALFV